MINHVIDMYNLQDQTVYKFGLDCTGIIEYRFNQQGFRSSINFNKTPQCALFGGSLVFGIGVQEKHTTAASLPNTYNFGLAGKYTNLDIHTTIINYLNSKIYSPESKLCVVWTDRNQDVLPDILNDLKLINLYHFFCGEVISEKNCFSFIKNLDQDVSGTHMGPKTHNFFAKILWDLFNQ